MLGRSTIKVIHLVD